MLLQDKFPPFYHALLPEFLRLAIPEEKFSDCSNCHLCASDKLSVSQSKCCTYHVILPNYMVGAILLETDAQFDYAKSTITGKIDQKHGVTPYGIAGTSDILEHEDRRKSNRDNKLMISFEDRARYTCPFLKDTSCSIWKYRSELCITYFCNPVSGRKGTKFWGAVYKFVRYMEYKLSNYALRKLGYPIELMSFSPLQHDSYDFLNKDKTFNQRKYDKLWADFDEVTLYKKCYEIISALDASQLKTILGMQGEWMMEQCIALLDISNQHVIPDYLVFSEKNKVESTGSTNYKITSPTGKSLHVSKRLLLGLKSFDGTKNPQDILRDSKMIFPVNSRRLHHFIDAGILEKADSVL